MKKFLLAALLLFMTSSAIMAQDTTHNAIPNVLPIAHFNELKHQFGKIPHGTPATALFTFINKGKAPLIIETAAASCGCTTPTYPKQPIMPGKTGTIKVTYNAEALNHFVKMVTVKFAQHQRPVNLVIEGDVIKK